MFATIAAVWRMLSKLPMEYRSNMAKTGGVAVTAATITGGDGGDIDVAIGSQ